MQADQPARRELSCLLVLPSCPAPLQEDAALEQEAEKRGAVVHMRQAISEETAANEQRRAQLATAQERVAKLRVSGWLLPEH